MLLFRSSLSDGGSGDTVIYTPVLTEGTKTGEISINTISTDMFAPTPPANTSELTNDSGFIINTVNNLINYYSKTEVDDLISSVVGMHFEIVQTLPVSDIDPSVIYLILNGESQEENIYDEYIYVNDAWELIGTTKIDLSDYITTEELDEELINYVTSSNLMIILSNYARISNLATVATSGSYEDLTDKPSIPAPQVNADWDAASGVSEILHKPSIPSATSDLTNDTNFVSDSNYVHTDNNFSNTDVSKLASIEIGAKVNVQSDWNEADSTSDAFIKNKPTIPAPGDSVEWTQVQVTGTKIAEIDINGTTQDVFTSAVPTRTSDLVNDSDFIDDSDLTTALSDYTPSADLADVALSGDYDDLSNTPSIPDSTSDLVNDSDFVSDASYVHTDNNYTNAEATKLAGIEAGAEVNVQSDWSQSDTTADDYIKNKPSIPAPQIQSDWTQSDSTALDYIKNKPTVPPAQIQSDWSQSDTTAADYIKNKPAIPTKVSDLTNDTGFITSTVANLTNYYTKSETYTQTEIDALISSIVTLNILVVQTLPTQDISQTTIYLVPKQPAGTQDVYDEYINLDGTSTGWENIGTTQVDLSNYYTKSEVDGLLLLKANAADLATVATSGDYSDLSNTPSIPTATSDLTNDSGFIDGTALATALGDYTPTSNLADVALSNNYSDLDNLPTIPAAQVQTDWAQTDTSAIDYIKNKPLIPAAQIQSDWEQLDATAADYIKNKPAIPTSSGHTIWNAIKTALTQRPKLWFADAKVADDSTEQATKVEVVQLIDDEDELDNAPDGIYQGDYEETIEGVLDASMIAYDEGTVEDALDELIEGGGSYTAGDGINIDANDEISVDTVFTEASTRTNIASGDSLSTLWGKIKKFFTDLKTVAFTGSYTDLSDQPTIPTNTNQLTNGAGFITSSGSCAYATSAGSATDSTKVAKSGDTMTGILNINTTNNVAMDFRPNNGDYHTTISYQTAGNEACVFATKQAVTSLIFINGEDSITNHANTRWQSLVPGLQLKNNCVAIGKLIANGTTPSYKLDVNGVVNATAFNGGIRDYNNNTPTYFGYSTSGMAQSAAAWLAAWDTSVSGQYRLRAVKQADLKVYSASTADDAFTAHSASYATSAGSATSATYAGYLKDGKAYIELQGASLVSRLILQNDYNLVLYKNNSAIWNTGTSSRRFKHNIQSMTEERAKKILQIRPVTFDWNDGQVITTQKCDNAGVIAEEVSQIIPDVVVFEQYDNDPNTRIERRVEYERFTPYLIKMVQIQQKQIDTMQATISTLEHRLSILEAK